MYSGVKALIVFIHTYIQTHDVKTNFIVIIYLHLGLYRFHNLKGNVTNICKQSYQ